MTSSRTAGIPGRESRLKRSISGGPPISLLVLLIALLVILGASLVVNKANIGTLVLTVVLAVPIMLIGRRLARPADARWLPVTIAAGFVAKLIGSGARYWVLINVYGGVGDAGGYHTDGLRMADTWRSFSIPDIGTGTDFIGPATGLLYVPYEPMMLGGFFIFATLAFIGELFMLAAFRRVSTPHHFKLYTAAILFMPTIAYWPSSIGKEALIFLFMGPAMYGAARLVSEYRLRLMIPVAVGLAGVGAIREHIAFMLAAALLLAVGVAKAPAVPAAFLRRLMLLGVSGVIVVAAVLATSQRFGFDLSGGVSADVVGEEVDPFLADLSERTGIGGSAVEGGVIQSFSDVPEATLRVLFRPLPWEATSAQTVASGLEGGFLLGLLVIRLPAMLRSLRHLRRKPYALFSLIFTGGFVFAFSAIVNLGILARQRSQVMPFLVAYLVETGFKDRISRPQDEAIRQPVGVAA